MRESQSNEISDLAVVRAEFGHSPLAVQPRRKFQEAGGFDVDRYRGLRESALEPSRQESRDGREVGDFVVPSQFDSGADDGQRLFDRLWPTSKMDEGGDHELASAEGAGVGITEGSGTPLPNEVPES